MKPYNPENERVKNEYFKYLGYSLGLNIYDMTAWSKNLGHNHLNTTLSCYGNQMSENEHVKRLQEICREKQVV